MKDLDKLKDYEFSELLSNVSFVEKKENVDEDGDLLKEELLNVDTKKSNHNFLAIATNFAFTIFSPVILLVGIYLIIIKFLQIKKNDIFIVFLMLLGVLSGYWSLYKDIRKISKKGLKMKLKIKKLNDNAKIPTYATDEAAGSDLYACSENDICLKSGETVMVKTGISLEIPKGYVGLVYARSGLAFKKGIAPANKVGVIDSDYRGEIMVALYNHSKEDYIIEKNERIAQLVITPYIKVDFELSDTLNETKRSEGGFGSTGKKIGGRMDIKPLGKRILVKVEKIENKTKSGLILIEDTNYFENFAKIIEVGDDIINLNIGDYVIFDKEKSLEVRKNNDIEYIVNLEDVYAKVGK